MDLTITRRMWDHPNSYTNPSLEFDFENTLKRIDPDAEIAEIHPEREEILVKIHNKSDSSYSKSIRAILQELQRQTQRSFVALVSSTSPYILITVRG
ncbi:MAG: hypothetical protein ACFFDI_20500 [Promethearchaeota archaeon]